MSASRAGWLAVTETIAQNCSKTNGKLCFLLPPRLLGLRQLSSAAWAGPGRRIFDAVDGLLDKHIALRRESDDQGVESLILSTDGPHKHVALRTESDDHGVESLILSTDCPTNTLLYVRKVTARV